MVLTICRHQRGNPSSDPLLSTAEHLCISLLCLSCSGRASPPAACLPSHSPPCRGGSAKGAQRGLTRPRRETHEGEQIIATPHSTITESGLSSSAVRLRAVIISLRPTCTLLPSLRLPCVYLGRVSQSAGTCEANLRNGLVPGTVVVPPPRAAREYLGPGPESLRRRLE